MAYVAPSTRTTGTLITAAIWNQDAVANPIALYGGAMSISGQTIGDLPYASSTTQLGRIAAVAAGQVLKSAGTGTVPAWTSVPLLNGIAFPATQVASGDANTLDDYEEGAFSPTITGSGGGSGQVYTAQQGHYIKIGQLVVCWIQVTLSTEGTITGNALIGGLPFTTMAYSAVRQTPCVVTWRNIATNWVNIHARVAISGTTAELVGHTAAAASTDTNLTATDVDDDSSFSTVLIYRASA